MDLKIAFASAAGLVLVLMAGAAHAGSNNKSLLVQNGVTNTATIDQSGATNSTVGTTTGPLYAKQLDNLNVLAITQKGNNDSVGTASVGGSFAGMGAGVLQQNTFSSIVVKQGLNRFDAENNSVGSILQWSGAGAVAPGVTTVPSAGYSNSVTINQEFHDSIGVIAQRYDASGAVGNTISVSQNGGNNINSISQIAWGAGGAHNNNANVTMMNSGGGDNGASGAAFTGLNAQAAAGAVNYWAGIAAHSTLNGGGTIAMNPIGQSTIVQRGTDNTFGLNINGSGNLFGYEQIGVGNTISSGVSGGLNTQVAVRQDGDFNSADTSLSGAGNELGIAQFNDGSVAHGYLSGTNNSAGIVQNGLVGINTATVKADATTESNLLQIVQAANGGNNSATINANGTAKNNRHLVVQYDGGPGANSATINFEGSNNNTSTSFGAGTAALAEATNAGLYGAPLPLSQLGLAGDYLNSLPKLSPGFSLQSGANNSLNIDVRSDNNLFATAQVGLNNTITSTIMGGGNNSLAIFQSSATAGNIATTIQNGSFNSIGLNQVGTNAAYITQ